MIYGIFLAALRPLRLQSLISLVRFFYFHTIPKARNKSQRAEQFQIEARREINELNANKNRKQFYALRCASRTAIL